MLEHILHIFVEHKKGLIRSYSTIRAQKINEMFNTYFIEELRCLLRLLCSTLLFKGLGN